MKYGPRGITAWGVAVLFAMGFADGCFDVVMEREAPRQAEVWLTSSRVRALRRAFDGAPPVIPHALQEPPVWFAKRWKARRYPQWAERPRNLTPEAVARDACKTAANATFSSTTSDLEPGAKTTDRMEIAAKLAMFTRLCPQALIVESDFEEVPPSLATGDQAHPLAPPVIPRSLWMRENCVARRTGPSARPEIRSSLPERTNCRQCHLSQAAGRAVKCVGRRSSKRANVRFRDGSSASYSSRRTRQLIGKVIGKEGVEKPRPG